MFRPSETRDVSLSERRCEPGEEVREDRPETRLSARPSRRLISCSVPEPTKESSSSFTTSLGPGRGTDSVLGRPKLPSLCGTSDCCRLDEGCKVEWSLGWVSAWLNIFTVLSLAVWLCSCTDNRCVTEALESAESWLELENVSFWRLSTIYTENKTHYYNMTTYTLYNTHYKADNILTIITLTVHKHVRRL